MGGDYYDRDQVTYNDPIPMNSNTNTSAQPYSIGGVQSIHSSVKPLRWTDENLMSEVANPIVFALDVTGSMGEWAKIIYDKMPMFYGQIMMQKYLTDPAISFCAIGDHTGDDEPLQITEFGQGKAIDQLLSKLVLWKSGNGNEHESYELAAYFYDQNVDMINAELPFFFVTGDEGYFDEIQGKTLQTVFGKGIKQSSIPSKQVWQNLMQKYNVFHIHKRYTSANYEKKIRQQWTDLLGEERVLNIEHPKACVDIIMGAIALTAGRTLESYINDMKTRGQTSERIEEVGSVLLKYSQKLKDNTIIPVRVKSIVMENPQIENLNNVISNQQINQNSSVNEEDIKEISELAEKLLLEDLDEDDLNLREKMKEIKKSKGEQIPKEFMCPISKEICFDPVMTSDGLTFERKAIETWLESKEISPVSGKVLDSKILLPNFALKQLIRDYIQSSI